MALALHVNRLPGLSRGVTIFIPVYNEEEVLERNAKKVMDYAAGLGLTYELIIGSNGSTDRTVEIGWRLASAEFYRRQPGQRTGQRGSALWRWRVSNSCGGVYIYRLDQG